MLYIVATPIGNIEDITFRAVKILKSVDLILSEDTRTAGILFNHYEIEKKSLSYNDHNKVSRTQYAIRILKEGKNIALISESGTPCISDPGFYLVRECVKEEIKVCPVPGPCAAISALVCSGLPTDRFTFYGFLPKKKGKKESIIREYLARGETAIFYESRHRIKNTLDLLKDMDANVVVARELTKKFEEILHNPKEVIEKGEFVILVGKGNGLPNVPRA